jgi:hypothetical protein
MQRPEGLVSTPAKSKPITDIQVQRRCSVIDPYNSSIVAFLVVTRVFFGVSLLLPINNGDDC